MRHPSGRKRILQGADYNLLANDLGKGLGPGFSGKDKIGQGTGKDEVLVSLSRTGIDNGLQEQRITRV
jgi:hypothetical protein